MSVTASLTSFIDFNCVLGPQRIRVPAGLRAMYDDPTRHPWAYYGPMIEAIRGGLAAGNLPERLERATADAETRVADGWFRGQWRHYRELSEGALLLSQRVGPVTVFPAPTGSWTHGELTLRVSPQLGVQRRDGRREAWFLYPKERPLAQATADAALLVLSDVLGAAGSDLVPRVVDIRRSTGFVLSRNRSLATLSAYVAGEAEMFARFWELSAA
jgi:hypothetical protein